MIIYEAIERLKYIIVCEALELLENNLFGISTSQALRKEKIKMYESPISLITQEVYEQTEEMIYRAVTKVGVDVDKEELVKALQYDRNQYDKAFMEGYNKAIDDFVEELKDYFVIPHDVRVVEMKAEQLKAGGEYAGSI